VFERFLLGLLKLDLRESLWLTSCHPVECVRTVRSPLFLGQSTLFSSLNTDNLPPPTETTLPIFMGLFRGVWRSVTVLLKTRTSGEDPSDG
jgi:hypothetical protein